MPHAYLRLSNSGKRAAHALDPDAVFTARVDRDGRLRVTIVPGPTSTRRLTLACLAIRIQCDARWVCFEHSRVRRFGVCLDCIRSAVTVSRSTARRLLGAGGHRP